MSYSESTVLNDIVIHRAADMAITRYEVFVNGQLLGNFEAGTVLYCPLQQGLRLIIFQQEDLCGRPGFSI